MQLEVPEGTYELTVAGNGYGGSTEVAVTRDEQTSVDVDSIKGEDPKYCTLTFAVDVAGALMYIDGSQVDYTQPLQLQYGIHSIQITADGYDTWSKRLYVNSPEAQIEIALEIAMKAHKGQRDLDGNPVILHPLTVALKGNNESEIVAGLLHDVVEDTKWTFEDLLEAGIEPEVVDVLRLLTHSKDVPYHDYVKRIADSHNPIAINVKCNDLEHNLDRGRRGDHLKQVAKHTAAKEIIHRINGDKGAAWDLLMDLPGEGEYWQAKYAFQIEKKPIEEATDEAGITIDEYMHFFHPNRKTD